MGVLLSTPITTKDSSDGVGEGCAEAAGAGTNSYLRFGCSAMQGWRTGMEDAHICDTTLDKNTSLFGVFDGHGGEEVAQFCGAKFGAILKRTPSYAKGAMGAALIEAFLAVDRILASPEVGPAEFGVECVGLHAASVGCTAVCALIRDGTLYVANAGDSRCVVGRRGARAFPMSIDHKPQLDEEAHRIAAAGGYVQNGRVNGNLNLSRSLGDLEYKRDRKLPPQAQIISGYPDIRTLKITEEEEFVVLGCDGIWDVMSSQDVVTYVSKWLSENPEARLSSLCEGVLDRCLAREAISIGCDNMSFMVVVLHTPNMPLTATPSPAGQPAPADNAGTPPSDNGGDQPNAV
eukprot:TRINITY_DN134_c1_g1_i1.p1 TRINITY_DN134_c1_g1~~TRINITY_DN134_c1_g1_i1.p1  ORF type:complete len:366 (+),score=93.56 TRINITY_DN134_c1_g1_i1:59-1099(+)